jgi:hypothetical protein
VIERSRSKFLDTKNKILIYFHLKILQKHFKNLNKNILNLQKPFNQLKNPKSNRTRFSFLACFFIELPSLKRTHWYHVLFFCGQNMTGKILYLSTHFVDDSLFSLDVQEYKHNKNEISDQDVKTRNNKVKYVYFKTCRMKLKFSISFEKQICFCCCCCCFY